MIATHSQASALSPARTWRSLVRLTALALVAAASLTSSTHAQCATATQAEKEIAPDVGRSGAQFGFAVAISGNTLASAGPYHDFGTPVHDGRVYIYTRTSADSPWTLEAEIDGPANGTPGECFGESIALHNNTLVIGTGCATTLDNGAAYIYTRSAGVWTQQAKLTDPTANNFGVCVATNSSRVVVGGDVTKVFVRSGNSWLLEDTLPIQFCNDVAIWGDTLAAGDANFYDGVGGEVQVYRVTPTGWALQQTIRPDSVPYGQFTADSGDGFGASVDLVAETLLVGAPYDQIPTDPSTADRGAAFVFTRSGTTWTQYSKITPLTSIPGSIFGTAVGLIPGHTTFAAIGASSRLVSGPGRVYTFELSSGLWLQRQIITPTSSENADWFGDSLALDGGPNDGTLIVGAPHFEPNTSVIPSVGATVNFRIGPTSATQTQSILERSRNSCNNGYSVAISGDYAVIGAHGDDVLGIDAGAAHVLYNTGVGGWQHVTTLYGANADSLAGYSVDISDDASTIAVGIPYDGSSNIGHVYMYTRSGSGLNSTWTFRQAIQSSDGATDDHFGSSVDLLGDLLLVGAPEDNNTEGTNAGAVYVYTRTGNTWASETKIAPFDLVAGDQFGVSAKLMTSTRMAVGAYGDDTGALVNSGAVYIIDLQPIIGGQAWTVTEVLIPADVATGDNFGFSLATSSNNLVIAGSLLDDNAGGVDAGAAYVFRATGIPGTLPNTWSQQAKLAAAIGGTNERFGYSVAYDNGTIVVGMPLDDNAGGADAGAAFVFRQVSGVWTEQFRFGAADRTTGDQLGLSVAIDGDFIACGAPFEDNDTGVDAGAVYFFDYSIAPPVITANPSPVTACTGTAEVYFGLIASGGPLTYRWYRDNVPMNDVPGHIAGAFTSALTITGPVPADAGLYKCQAVNPCGFTFTAEARLTVCPADFNCSGAMSVQDIFDFLNAYFAASPRADFNLSGSITVQDIFDFLAAYFAGCA